MSRHRCAFGVTAYASAGLWVSLALACSGASQTEALAPSLAVSTVSSEAEGSSQTEAAEVGGQAESGSEMSAPARAAYEAGLRAFRSGDMEGAAARFDEALEINGQAAAVHVARGFVRERAGERTAALSDYATALESAPAYGPAISARTSLLIRMGRAADAEDFARGLVARHPESAAALSALAEVRSVRGDSTSAQELAQKALKKDPDHRPAMLTLARDHYRARRLDLSLYTLRAILDGYGKENPPRDKHNPDARFLRALIFKEQGRRTLAFDELKAVLEHRPDMVDARLHLATYMLEAGNANEARPLLEEALRFDPSNVLVHLNLGDAYRLMGKPKDALDHLQWVARQNEGLAQVHYNLGLVYLFSPEVPGLTEEQAIDEAIASFELFKKLEPRAARGKGDDVEELLARARNKKSILEALKAEPSDDSDDDGWE